MSTLLQAFFDRFGRKSRRRAAQGAIPGKPKFEPDQSQWIPLAEAAQVMYDELAGTGWRTEAEQLPTPEARLDYMALHLVHNAPIEGRSPPSSSYKRVPSSDFDTGVIKGGGKYFQRHYESYLTFIDMRVRAEDLRDALGRMKATR